MKFIKIYSFALLFVYPIVLIAQTESVDQDVMKKIRNEGLLNSKVMDIAFNITEVSGPRVTNSPGFMRAANYAMNQFTQWICIFGKIFPID
jgi:carboxypeptidase Q